MENNPFLQKYDTPFEAIPFDKIELSHIIPAIKHGIAVEQQQIDAIVENVAQPTFENTIEALEGTGEIISKVTSVLNTYMNSRSDDELQTLSEEAYSLLTEHRNNIYLNEELFEKIRAVRNAVGDTLIGEQKRLLDTVYQNFVRAGAELSKEDKEKYRELSQRLN